MRVYIGSYTKKSPKEYNKDVHVLEYKKGEF